MEGYYTCDKCNGRGVLLNTLRNHWIGNKRCDHPGSCKNILIDICPVCGGLGQVLWIDRIIRKEIYWGDLRMMEKEKSYIQLQLKEILEEFKLVDGGDLSGTLNISFHR